MNSKLEKIVTGTMAGLAFVASFGLKPKYTSMDHLVSTAQAEMMTVNGYKFDFNENGWLEPNLNGAEYLGTRTENLGLEKPVKSTGYKLQDGSIVAKYEYKGQLIQWKFNSKPGEDGYVISRIKPDGTLDAKFKYKAGLNDKYPNPKIQ